MILGQRRELLGVVVDERGLLQTRLDCRAENFIDDLGRGQSLINMYPGLFRQRDELTLALPVKVQAGFLFDGIKEAQALPWFGEIELGLAELEYAGRVQRGRDG